MDTIASMESEVRSYSRSFPALFVKARNERLWDADGREYIDFFAGAGALNYGHNPPMLKRKLIEYLHLDGITHTLDMVSSAKIRFLDTFRDIILAPRGMGDYKVMFPGPTGTNAVESALKLARKVTGRSTVVSFTGGFHGMTLGALSATGNRMKRAGAGLPLGHVVSMPYDGYFGDRLDTADYLERMLADQGSGLDLPAAILLETVQGEGGLHAASPEWLRRMATICQRHGVLLIVDDVQMGCGRTGPFFSFETAGIEPDLVCLSKSIGGYGLPMALTLMKPEHDLWKPGEHNGTFRGNNLSFVAAAEALSYWSTPRFEHEIRRKSARMRQFLLRLVRDYPGAGGELRGRGLVQGLAFPHSGFAEHVCRKAFTKGLIMETSGPDSEVIKLMPPLTIEDEQLEQGLAIVEQSLADTLNSRHPEPAERGAP